MATQYVTKRDASGRIVYKKDSYGYDKYDAIGRRIPVRVKKKVKPRDLRQILTVVRRDKTMNEGMKVLERERKGEFETKLARELAGIALHRPAAEYVEAELDRLFREAELPERVEEVVVGAGFHAAVYCSVRVAMGHPKPLVIEASDRAGGAFAVSRAPSFYLNSRNRPGDLGIPGRAEALNTIPGAPVQPAMLSGDEYQRNSDLAYAIRMALALNARVITEKEVGAVRRAYGKDRLTVTIGRSRRASQVKAQRVIWATGMGVPKLPGTDHKRVLSFDQLMARADEPFPLRDMCRVAVVGAGDSGRTAIEALIGQSPGASLSVAGLDWIERIDWYGMNADSTTRDGWESCNRSRYKSIARALPRRTTGRNRITPYTARVAEVKGGYDSVQVNGRRYDHVIWCTGFEPKRSFIDDPIKYIDSRGVARERGPDTEYVIGPAADLPLEADEEDVLPNSVPENSVALFRYIDRTATLAAALG